MSIDLLAQALVVRANPQGVPTVQLRTEWLRVKGGMGYDGSAPAVDCQPRIKVAPYKCRLRPTGA